MIHHWVALGYTPAEADALDRAMQNGTHKLLAWQIQKLYHKAGQQWLPDADALQIAADKIAGHVKLPPDLKPEHIQRCPRCSRAHLVPLSRDEKRHEFDGRHRDAVERLCKLAQAVANQDYGSQPDVVLGNRASDKLKGVADALDGRAFTTGGGKKVASGHPHFDGEEKAAPGHQGTGTDHDGATSPTKQRRFATGDTTHNTILRDVEDEIRDKLVRQAEETLLTDRKKAWMTKDHGSATERQQEAAYLVNVCGWSAPEAGKRMGVSKTRIQALLRDYAKNAG
jgi:hypothetical protein